jgi:hypothetical protein
MTTSTMKRYNHKVLILTLVLLLKASIGICLLVPDTKYLDATNGNDSNDGATPETAWKSLHKVSQTTFNPGDAILLKAGEVWSGQVFLKGSGTDGKPIRLDKYGEGANPVINGVGNEYTIFIYNQEYWEISHLEITNFDPQEEGMSLESWEAENKSVWADATSVMPKYDEERSKKSGILIEAEDFGVVHHLHFTNLEIHGVNGDISNKDNGGIFFKILGDEVPTYFDDVLIENCYVHDVDRTGISNKSTWMDRTLNENDNWVPSINWIVRNNTVERSGGNGMIIRVNDKALVENNLFKYCSIKWTGNAFFPFNCDDIIVQFNESCYTKYNEGDADAGGLDSDYRCKRSVFQYNYSHHNERGGILICCKGGVTRFNDGTIVRYNIFQDNEQHVFRVSGVPTNTYIYNNLIYTGEGNNNNDIIWHKSWSGYPDRTLYYNNIFYNDGSGNAYDLGSSTNNTFENNLFFGSWASNEPSDPKKISEDPLLVEAGSGVPEGFMISEGSPAIGTGKRMFAHPRKDFFGNHIPAEGPVDIGANQYNASMAIWDMEAESEQGFSRLVLYPNPTSDFLSLDCSNLNSAVKYLRIFNGRGKEILLTEVFDQGNDANGIIIKLSDYDLKTGIYYLGLGLEKGEEIVHPFVFY